MHNVRSFAIVALFLGSAAGAGSQGGPLDAILLDATPSPMTASLQPSQLSPAELCRDLRHFGFAGVIWHESELGDGWECYGSMTVERAIDLFVICRSSSRNSLRETRLKIVLSTRVPMPVNTLSAFFALLQRAGAHTPPAFMAIALTGQRTSYDDGRVRVVFVPEGESPGRYNLIFSWREPRTIARFDARVPRPIRD